MSSEVSKASNTVEASESMGEKEKGGREPKIRLDPVPHSHTQINTNLSCLV